MKRIIATLLALVTMTALFTACGGTKEIDYKYNGFIIYAKMRFVKFSMSENRKKGKLFLYKK